MECAPWPVIETFDNIDDMACVVSYGFNQGLNRI